MAEKKKTGLANPPKKSAPKTESSTAGKAPKKEELRRLSPGVYRNSKGETVNSKGERINRSGQRVKDPKKDDGKKKETKPTTPATPPAPTGAANPTPFDQQTPEQQVGNVQTEVGQSMMDYLGQLQSQGAFNPGDYEASYQQAAQNVMDQFQMQNAQQFQQEAEGVEEMIAQRGIDPTGRQAERLRAQMAQNQGNLKRQAQLAAEQAGRTVQQQRFEQDLTRYNVPTDQIAKIGSLFTGQLGSVEAQRQREFEGQQNKLTREQQMKMAQMNKGGGGPDPMALMEREYQLKRDLLYDQAAIQGQNNGGGNNVANSAASGFAQGFGAGLGSNLGRR